MHIAADHKSDLTPAHAVTQSARPTASVMYSRVIVIYSNAPCNDATE